MCSLPTLVMIDLGATKRANHECLEPGAKIKAKQNFRTWVISLRHQPNLDDQPWHTLSIDELTTTSHSGTIAIAIANSAALNLLLCGCPRNLRERWHSFSEKFAPTCNTKTMICSQRWQNLKAALN